MTNQYTYNEQQNHHDGPGYMNDAQKPFKRTAEKVLTWVGIVLHLIWAVILFGAIQMFKSPEFQREIDAAGQDISQIENIGAPTILLALLPLVLAIVAVFIFKKNILAGILLILAAATGVFLSGSLVAGLLWLIAGIMLIVRKPKRQNDMMYAPDSSNDDDAQQNTSSDPYVYRNDTTPSVNDENRVERDSDLTRESHSEERNGFEQNIKEDTKDVENDITEGKDK